MTTGSTGSYSHWPQLRVQHLERTYSGYYLGIASGDSYTFRAALATIRELPQGDRRWIDQDRLWWISASGMATLARRLPAVGDALMRLDAFGEEHEGDPSLQFARRMAQAAAAPIVPPAVQEALTGLHLLPSAPAGVVQAVYRQLAKQHHPDKGGQKEAMQRLNKQYELALAWSRKAADPLAQHDWRPR